MLLEYEVITNLMKKLERYIKQNLNISVEIIQWDNEKKLSLYLRELYIFFKINLLSKPFLLMILKDDKEQTPVTVRKHIMQLQNKWNVNIIYVTSFISSYNRIRLIKQNVPFIIPDNQMYLPMLGLDLREHFRSAPNRKENISPSTQAIVIYILYHKKYDDINLKELSLYLGYSLMTLNRALNQLYQLGIIKLKNNSRKGNYRLKYSGKILWEKISPYMVSPVKRRIFIPIFMEKKLMVVAGLSALSYFSMIGEPQKRIYAIYSPSLKILKQDKKYIELPLSEPKSIELELWSYNPVLLSENGFVDRLSLYLTLKDDNDERIIKSLEEMLKCVEW